VEKLMKRNLKDGVDNNSMELYVDKKNLKEMFGM
jgi:hypothetical protein